MVEVGVHDAKTRLSELPREVEASGEVVATRAGRAVARLFPMRTTATRVERFGVLRAEIDDPGDWDDEDGMADRFGIPVP